MKQNCIVANETRPFLRWVGGKSWLIKHLDNLLPSSGFNNYHEPFLGGAAVFLSIKSFEKAFLSDYNKELISVYKALKKDPEGIIKQLKLFKNEEQEYYAVRNKHYDDKVKEAAKFIYLNQTSFNGIYRVNLKGEYNVPYGYRSKVFLDADALRKVSKALKKASLKDGDFELVRENIKKRDLVFLDPPYTVSHNDNGFIKYNQKLFSIEDQKRLSILIDFIKKKDAFYILTNAAHTAIDSIFEKGDKKVELKRASLVGGSNARRGQTSEYIFTNTR